MAIINAKVNLYDDLSEINPLSVFETAIKNKNKLKFTSITLSKSLLQNFEKVAISDFEANYINNSIPSWSFEYFHEILSSTVSHDTKWNTFLPAIMKILELFIDQSVKYKKKDLYVWWNFVKLVTIAIVGASNKHENLKNAVLNKFSANILLSMTTRSFYVDVEFLCEKYSKCVIGADQEIRAHILAKHSNLFIELASMVIVSLIPSTKLAVLEFLVVWLTGLRDRNTYAEQWFNKALIRKAFCQLTFDDIDGDCRKFLDTVEMENSSSIHQTYGKNMSSKSVHVNRSLLASQMQNNQNSIRNHPDHPSSTSRPPAVAAATKNSIKECGPMKSSVVLVDCVKFFQHPPIRVNRKIYPLQSSRISPRVSKQPATRTVKMSSASFQIYRSKLGNRSNFGHNNLPNVTDSDTPLSTSIGRVIPVNIETRNEESENSGINKSGSAVSKNILISNDFAQVEADAPGRSDLSEHINEHFVELASKQSIYGMACNPNNVFQPIKNINDTSDSGVKEIVNQDLNMQHLLDEALGSMLIEKEKDTKNRSGIEKSNNMDVGPSQNGYHDNDSPKNHRCPGEDGEINSTLDRKKHSEECIVDTPDRKNTKDKIKITKKCIAKLFKEKNFNKKIICEIKNKPCISLNERERDNLYHVHDNNKMIDLGTNRDVPIMSSSNLSLEKNKVDGNIVLLPAEKKKATPRNRLPRQKKIQIISDILITKGVETKQIGNSKNVETEIKPLKMSVDLNVEEIMSATAQSNNRNRVSLVPNVTDKEHIKQRTLKKPTSPDVRLCVSPIAYKTRSFSTSKRRTLFSPRLNDFKEIDSIGISNKKTRMPSNTLAVSYSQIENARVARQTTKCARNKSVPKAKNTKSALPTNTLSDKHKVQKASEYRGDCPAPSFSYRSSKGLTSVEEKYSKLFDSLLEQKTASPMTNKACTSISGFQIETATATGCSQNTEIRKKNETVKRVTGRIEPENSEEIFILKTNTKHTRPKPKMKKKKIGDKRKKKTNFETDKTLIDERIRSAPAVDKNLDTSFVENIIINFDNNDLEPDRDALEKFKNDLIDTIDPNSRVIIGSAPKKCDADTFSACNLLSQNISFTKPKASHSKKQMKTLTKSKVPEQVVFESEEDDNMPSLIIEKVPPTNDSAGSREIEGINYNSLILDSTVTTNNTSAIFNITNVGVPITVQQTARHAKCLNILPVDNERIQSENISNYSHSYKEYDRVSPLKRQLTCDIANHSTFSPDLINRTLVSPRVPGISNRNSMHTINTVIAKGVDEMNKKPAIRQTNSHESYNMIPSIHSIDLSHMSLEAASEDENENSFNIFKYKTKISDIESVNGSLQSVSPSRKKTRSTATNELPTLVKLKKTQYFKKSKKQSGACTLKKSFNVMTHKEVNSVNNSFDRHCRNSPSHNIIKWLNHQKYSNEETVDYLPEDVTQPYAHSDLEARLNGILGESELNKRIQNVLQNCRTVIKLMDESSAELILIRDQLNNSKPFLLSVINQLSSLLNRDDSN